MNKQPTIPEHIFVGHIKNQPSCSDDEELHEIWPKFMVMVFFDGGQKFEIDGTYFSPGVCEKPRLKPTVFLLSITKFSKIRFFDIKQGNLTKVMVSAPRTWVERIFESFDSNARGLNSFLSGHLQTATFFANEKILRPAHQILNPPKTISPELLKLHERRMGIDLLYESCLSFLESRQSSSKNIRYSHFDIAEGAKNFIFDHIDKDITAAQIADSLNVTISTLQRAFKTFNHQPMSDFIRKERMKKARFLLENKGLAVSQVGYCVGYNNPSNFATAYRREYGVAPKEHRLK